jgi:hypothetical protein
MHTRDAMKRKRSICGRRLRSAGLDGVNKSFKDKDLMLGILSNWQTVMLNCEL